MLLLLAISAPAFAAGSTDFYLTLLRRGAADVEAGRHADATAMLRLAAFGLLESIEHYETAQAYLAVALDHLGQTDEARQAAQRIVAAERVEKKFRGIALPAAIRTAFESVAKKVLSASDASALSGGATAPVTAAPAIVDKVDVVTETRKPVIVPAKPVETPKVQPPAPKPQPQPQTSQPAKPQPQTQKPQPQPAPVQPQRTTDVPAQLSAGERALTTANINEARRIYRDLLTVQGLDHGTMIRIGEGLYRSRDFANVLAAFDRAGTLRSGEEAYRYYLAVAAFEVGQFDRARRELAAALPFIELTPDVQRYRTKIEAAR
jgi:tetratricopeptide (TPR) repeat protein